MPYPPPIGEKRIAHIFILFGQAIIPPIGQVHYCHFPHKLPPKYCSESKLLSSRLPPRMIHSVLEWSLISIVLIVIKAYRRVCPHRLSLKSWFLIPPLTAVTTRSNPFDRVYPTSLGATPIPRVNDIAYLNHLIRIHKLPPLSLVQHPNGIRS
jgi:hypothetical protein